MGHIGIVKWFADRLRKLDRIYNWPAVAIAAFIIIFWQLGGDAGILPESSFGTPLAISEEFWRFGSSGELWGHLSASLFRAAMGFIIGISLGLIIGLLTGALAPVRRALDSILTLLYGFPKIALLPLLIIILGTGDTMRIVLIAIVSFFPMWLNSAAGVRAIDEFMIRVAKNFGANNWQVITKVAIPSIIPYAIAGAKYSAGIAIHLIVIAEMIAADKGIGYLVWLAGAAANVPLLFMGIIILVVTAAVVLWLFDVVESRIAPWRVEVQET